MKGKKELGRKKKITKANAERKKPTLSLPLSPHFLLSSKRQLRQGQRRRDPARSGGGVLGGVLPCPPVQQLRQPRLDSGGKPPVGLGRREESGRGRGCLAGPDGVGI